MAIDRPSVRCGLLSSSVIYLSSSIIFCQLLSFSVNLCPLPFIFCHILSILGLLSFLIITFFSSLTLPQSAKIVDGQCTMGQKSHESRLLKSIGPHARPFAHSLTPLIHSLALHCCCRFLLRIFICSLTNPLIH